MYMSEPEADEIIEGAEREYKEQFKQEFPFYEYIDMAMNDDGVVDVKGAEKLSKFIIDRVVNNNPVPIPKDYDQRLY